MKHRKPILDAKTTGHIIDYAWRHRWMEGSRWMYKYPFSEVRKINKKVWQKFVDADRVEKGLLPITKQSKKNK